MLEARITSSRGSLYFSGTASPYDLETLRQHLHDFRRPALDRNHDVTLEVMLDDGPRRPFVVAWLWAIKAAGFRVHVLRSQPVDHAAFDPVSFTTKVS
jgi:hypothetical protein